MLTEKDYCDYDTCVALKELGYDGYCAAYYHLFDDDEDARNSFEHIYVFDFQNSNNIYRVGAPLLYQAQKWLRNTHNLHLEITYSPSCWTGKIYDLNEWDYIKGFTFFESFEETLHTLIKEAVKILKEK